MEKDFSRGSEWRRWDLHLHTSSSYDYEDKSKDSNKNIIEMLRREGIEAVAITDHFVIDAEKINALRKLAPEITYFPGVELRTDKASKTGNLHIILIFSERCDVKTLQDDFNAIMYRGNAKNWENNDRIYWNFEDVIDFANKQDAIVTIHAGKKAKGIDKEVSNAVGVNEAIKEDIAKSIDFFEIGRMKDIDDYNQHVFKKIKRKPLLLCSDNHDPSNYDVKEKLWIKANTTFEGLKQCIYQPEERVYIGEVPLLVDRVNNNKQLIIDCIEIKQIENAKNPTYKWFNTSLNFNQGLVSVIGNKGSGKSAIADILSQLCGAKTITHASFLSNARFKKMPTNFANDYTATLEWYDGKVQTGNLSSEIDKHTPEYAQYLPQQYIEEICNDLGDSFQNEIDKVIFSYVDESERGDSLNLDELVSSRSKSVQLNIQQLKEQLFNKNEEIIKIEGKNTEAYKNTIKKGLETIKESINRHNINKPKVVPKPKKELNEDYQEQLKSLNSKIEEIQKAISESNKKQKHLNNQLVDFDELQTKLNIFVENAEEISEEIKNVKDKYKIETLKNIEFTTPNDAISSIITRLRKERDQYRNVILNDESASEESLPNLLKYFEEEKEKLISNANKEEKTYQRYIADLKKWEKKRDELVGDSNTDNTKTYFETELEYLDNEIENEYRSLKVKRREIIREIFNQKKSLRDIYYDIYNPIESKVTELVSKMDEKISFEVELILNNNNLAENLLSFINQRYAGLFKGKTESNEKMNSLIRETDFSDIESIELFIDKVMQVVYENLESSTKKVTNKEEFYSKIFGLDYIGINFQLKMGNRSLTELSPGERGIVLLTFFLALSKNNMPIIIDQPEDNLDNQSVFKKLVPCINEAKKKRQVFIVTHNPNIAIACDSEQIIYANMDKDAYRINYKSGAIEDNQTKEYVIDVLEGTMPAFDLRRQKYKIK